MTKLVDLCRVLRSKNAGPLTLTIDAMFVDKEQYDRVVKSGVINKNIVSKLYDVVEDDVQIIEYSIVNTLKISFPRKHVSGSLLDNDVYGCQLHRPIADIELNK